MLLKESVETENLRLDMFRRMKKTSSLFEDKRKDKVQGAYTRRNPKSTSHR